ncbi:hypothetical protein, partial [uncultured Campylobacter sp.]|uniref:hypothetical protein n=1 Tax=uncultured Campylobacter sp. TaxID=218934 RepID=UPI002601A1BE
NSVERRRTSCCECKTFSKYRDKFKLIMAKLTRKNATPSKRIQSYVAVFAASGANYAAKFRAKF